MSERWRRELRKLDGLEPPSSVVESAERGPRLPERGPAARSRIAAAFLAFAVFATAGTWAWQAFRPDDRVDRPSPGHVVTYPPAPTSGYYFLFPDESPVATNDPNGGVSLVVRTNLPDGTLVAIQDQTLDVDPSKDPQSSGSSCCPKVKDGEITVGVNNGSCYNLIGSTGNSWGFDVTVTAAPNPPSMMLGGGIGSERIAAGSSEPPRQPQSVLDILGPHFEHLAGDQVVQAGEDLTLVGTLHRPWPPDSCIGRRTGDIPDVCLASQEQIQGNSLKEAMGEVMGQINQARLCEMWQASLVPDAEAAHPWSEFRTEWERWLFDPPKDFTSGDSGVDSELEWHVVATDGDRSTIDLVLRGERIGQLVVASLPDWKGSDQQGVIAFWGVEDYTLFADASGS
jgi:hypothetical protein